LIPDVALREQKGADFTVRLNNQEKKRRNGHVVRGIGRDEAFPMFKADA
jgi:hypothetical protein